MKFERAMLIAEYTVTDMTVEPMRTYVFDGRKRLLGVWDRYPGGVSGPYLAVDPIPERIRRCVHG